MGATIWRDRDIGRFREAWAARPAAVGGVLPILAELRAGFDAEHSAVAAADGCEVAKLTGAAIRAEWLTPRGADPTRVLLYFHGGGHLFGSARSYRHLVSRLADAGGVVGCSLDYRLAPEHPFPAAIADALYAYQWLLEHGFEPSRIVLGGDSAGGNLAAALLLAIKEGDLPQPGGLYLLSPWLDMTMSGPSHEIKAGCDPILTTAALSEAATAYLAGRSPLEPHASPINGDFEGWPPIMIQVGSEEVLLSDSLRLAERAALAGVSVRLEVWDEMVHAWPLFHPALNAGLRAISTAGRWIFERTHDQHQPKDR